VLEKRDNTGRRKFDIGKASYHARVGLMFLHFPLLSLKNKFKWKFRRDIAYFRTLCRKVNRPKLYHMPQPASDITCAAGLKKSAFLLYKPNV